MKKVLAFFLTLTCLVALFPVTAAFAAGDNDVDLPFLSGNTQLSLYVSSTGSAKGNGTLQRPYDSPLTAMDKMTLAGYFNYTIYIMDAVTVNSAWNNHAGHTVRITGEGYTGASLSFAASSGIGDNVTFDNLQMTFVNNLAFCNGHTVTFGENITFSASMTVYGGANGGTLTETNLTILSGTYAQIYGGSNGGTITGDTHLYVGGTASAPTVNDQAYYGYILGGGSNNTIKGTAYTTFADSAYAKMVCGGDRYGAAIANIDLRMTGGTIVDNLYGGNAAGSLTGNVNITMTGGKTEGLFGGCQNAPLTGNVYIKLLGGEVTRRVYGGNYNNADGYLSYTWSSSHLVSGSITLILGDVNIRLSGTSDKGIFAGSRYKTRESNTQLIFLTANAYDKYKSKVSGQSGLLNPVTGEAANTYHYYTYVASGATLTQGCAYHTSLGATASITLDNTERTYTGEALEPATLTCSADWEYEAPVLTYENNVMPGTATAKIAMNGVVAAANFTIHKRHAQAIPALTATAETIQGKADGKMSGLTTAMEYSTDGAAFTAVTAADMGFAPGTYYVRYAETDTTLSSDITTVTIGGGRLLEVTFHAVGAANIVRQVTWDATLTDIPAVPTLGVNYSTAPVWNITDFSHIQSDLMVSAVYPADADHGTDYICTDKQDTTDMITDGNVLAQGDISLYSYTGNPLSVSNSQKEQLLNGTILDNGGRTDNGTRLYQFDMDTTYAFTAFMLAGQSGTADFGKVEVFIGNHSAEDILADDTIPAAWSSDNDGLAVRRDFALPMFGRYMVVRITTDDSNSNIAISEIAALGEPIPLTFPGGQVRNPGAEDKFALRFAFNMTAEGIGYKANGSYDRAIADDAAVTIQNKEYNILDFGVVVSLELTDDFTLENVNNKKTKNVPAQRLYSVKDDSIIYTAVVSNIPANHKNTLIYARPYIVTEAGVLYGAVQSRCVQDILTAAL